MPTLSKFQCVQFAYIKRSHSRDVSEGFDDAIVFIRDDARSPVLDPMTVSHFALARSHSLRGIDLFDIIPGLKLLKKLKSLLDLPVAFNSTFNHHGTFRNLLNTMTFRHD